MRQELADEDTHSIGIIPRAEIFEIWESPANPTHIQKSLSTGATALGAPPAELSSPVTTQLVTVIYSSLKSRVKYVLQKAGQRLIAKQRGGSEVILHNGTCECCRAGAGGVRVQRLGVGLGKTHGNSWLFLGYFLTSLCPERAGRI